MVDNQRFFEALNEIKADRERGSIGVLGEKTLHAALKRYYEPNTEYHEVKIGGFCADIARDGRLYEIQTGSFTPLKRKLPLFLENNLVTIVYPVVSEKYLVWIDEETGATSDRRKSPKTGMVYDALFELMRIKPFLKNPNLRIKILRLKAVDYRGLNGWDKSKKRGSSRYERVPLELTDELEINSAGDYSALLPQGLNDEFTVKEFAAAARRSDRFSGAAVNVLNYMGAVERTGKIKNAYVYKKR